MNLATETPWLRFAGANVKRDLPRRKARADFRVIRSRCSVFVAQECERRGHWLALARAARHGWRTFPSSAVGLVRPVFSAQLVGWQSRIWSGREAYREELHDGVARISPTRQLRAKRLEHRRSRLSAIFATTHFVVGGDEDGDGPIRKAILEHDLLRLARFLRMLLATGHVVVLQLDANIRPGSWAYVELMQIVTALGGRLVGQHGVEYLIVFDGIYAEVLVRRSWEIGTAELFTDHEVRGLTFRLRSRRPANTTGR